MATYEKIRLGRNSVLYPSAGTLDLLHRGKVIMRGATAEVTYRVGSHDEPAPRPSMGAGSSQAHRLRLSGGDVASGVGPDRVMLSRRDGHIELAWHIASSDEIELRLEVTNIGRQSIELDELRVVTIEAIDDGSLALSGSPSEWRFYQNGWQSWSPTFARRVGDGVYSEPATEDYRLKHQPHVAPSTPKTLTSEWFTVISSPSADGGLLLGFTTGKDQLAEVRLQVDSDEFSSLRAVCYADGVTLAAGDKLTSETLRLAAGEDPLALLEDYAARLGQAMSARSPQQIPTGWCTWYYFFGENTASDVLANVEAICHERLPLELVLIDDGYQTAIGDWLSLNEKFPDGMRPMTEAIKAAGLIPGLWVAPFGASRESRLFAEHPDWFLRDAEGNPVLAWTHFGSDIIALDLTHPDVQAWLGSLFRTLQDDWGFELFKLDFIFAAALPGVRRDRKATRAQAFRRGLEVIRQTVGESFLLGCGAPLAPSIGLVDGMRIGPDVHIDWESFWQSDLSSPAAKHALRNVVTRAFLHRRLWLNDPDCVLVRRRGQDSELVLNEMRTLVTLIGLSGGMVLESDNLPSIRRGRLKYLKQILPPYGETARPLDLFENELPSLFALSVERDFGNWLVVAVTNWADRTVSTALDLTRLGLDGGPYHAYNYWRRRYLGQVQARQDKLVLRQQPHETTLLLFKAVSDRPELLTSTFHVTQGGGEVKSVQWRANSGEGSKRQNVLTVELEKAGMQRGELLFTVPKQCRLAEARVNGRRQAVRRVTNEVVAVGFALDERATVELALNCNHPRSR
jgi:alpha-galactosidase